MPIVQNYRDATLSEEVMENIKDAIRLHIIDRLRENERIST